MPPRDRIIVGIGHRAGRREGIKAHLRNLMRRFGVRNRVELVVTTMAIREASAVATQGLEAAAKHPDRASVNGNRPRGARATSRLLLPAVPPLSSDARGQSSYPSRSAARTGYS